MLSELGRRPLIGGGEGSYGDGFEKEISLLLREQRRHEADDLEKELNLYRSGSAPPTVEGSLSAVGGLFNHGGGGAPGAFPGIGNNGFVSEEELRSDPAYLSYYYSNVNLNPRLPPPLLSKEDWRSAQRLQGGGTVATTGGFGDRKKLNRKDSGGGGRSMFSMPPGFSSKKGQSELESERIQSSAEWGGDGLIGLPGLEIGGKQNSFPGMFQDDLGHTTPRNISRPSSCNAVEFSKISGSAEEELAHLRNELASKDTKRSIMNVQSSPAIHKAVPRALHSHAAVIGASLSQSTTPDLQLIARSPSPCLAPIGGERVSSSDRKSINSQNLFNSVPATLTESTDLATALSSIDLSDTRIDEKNPAPPHAERDDHKDYLFNLLGGQNNDNPLEFIKRSESSRRNIQSAKQSANLYYSDLSRGNEGGLQTDNSLPSDRHHANAAPLNKMFSKGSPALNCKGTPPSYHQHMDSTNPSLLNYGLGGYHLGTAMPSMISNQIGIPNYPPLYENVAAASAMTIPGMNTGVFGGGMPSGSSLSPSESDLLNFNQIGNHMLGNQMQAPLLDPMYLQYLRAAEYNANVNDPSMERNYVGNSYMDLIQKAYLGSLLSPQKSQYGVPMGTKSSVSKHPGYYGAPSYGLGLSCPGSPMANPVIPNSPVGPGSPMRHGELHMRFPSAMRNLASSVMSPWHFQASFGMDDNFTASLLDEFKGNKSRCFELSEISGHVVEFSSDQYGSRFIQQQLETASVEEKNMVFEEIFPEALTLMTDVFGNYVIQKFFEHGMASQRRELANKLFGHVLTLSLQMYGCRVIQKAIEVVDLDQKIKMVQELDGHVMRSVRDQNGNHVIQKCIECVPEENIQFIVSTFYDQVITLSTHPYGCRVVQRILEHCRDPSTQSKVMDEILGSVSMLAQDQYGNYVIQHVLEHGKPHERSTIIEELAGKIVQMSQQKFASNVVEKCLTFGGPSERQLLVSEILGSTDENEPLQAMMKDQFANYVVQKVLETCDDQQREYILSRIKVHLNALKKYTYGKHIVARVEKLVAAGERRMAAQSQ